MSFDPTTAKQIPNFDGADYQPGRDNPRLRGQLLRVWNEVKAGEWKTLRSIADCTGDPEASVSAQLRHLRKDRFGAHEVERRHKGNGVYEYRLLINKKPLE
jgi:hypothetical protein